MSNVSLFDFGNLYEIQKPILSDNFYEAINMKVLTNLYFGAQDPMIKVNESTLLGNLGCYLFIGW